MLAEVMDTVPICGKFVCKIPFAINSVRKKTQDFLHLGFS
jgi:hypothetical protein